MISLQSTNSWHSFFFDTLRLARNLAFFVGFVYCIALALGRGWSDVAGFLRRAARAEFTERPGYIDLALCVIFAAVVLTPSIVELVFGAAGVGRLSTDPKLWNSDVKEALLLVLMLASLWFVGALSRRP